MIWFRRSESRTSTLTFATSPIWPMSMRSPLDRLPGLRTLTFRAWMSVASFPVNPTALPPCRLMKETISLFTVPPRTISTISIVSASVTPGDRERRQGLPQPLHHLVDLGASSVDDDGMHADRVQKDDVEANDSLSAGSVMAEPPYLMTIVFPRRRGCRGGLRSGPSLSQRARALDLP